MSLISQNARSKNEVNKNKREVEDDVENNDTLEVKKRKKDHEREQSAVEQVKEMKKLENFLFGSLYSPLVFGKDDDEVEPRKAAEKVSDLFFTDRSADSVLTVYQEEDADLSEGSHDDDDHPLQRKPVWVDDEEENATVNIAKVNRLRKLRKVEDEDLISGLEYVSRLRAQHVKLNPGTEWARVDSRIDRSSDDESTDDENEAVVSQGYGDMDVDDVLRTNEDLVVKSGSKLLPGHLEYSRLVDANIQDPANGPINSVQFHPNAQLFLAAGLDRKLRFFQIDGKRNTTIQSVFLEDCPIRKASFLPDGSQVIVSGRRKFFYSFDLVKARVDKIGPLVGREEKSLEVFEVSPDSQMIAFTGNEGYILLVSTKTKQLVGTLKMNGTIRSLAYTENGQKLLSSGGDGQVYHWDLRTMTCLHKGVDEGCINGTTLCTSPSGTYFAAGSDSGIVNIYNREEFLGGKRKPIRTIENLTTKVVFMRFNHDSQILAICSGMKKSSLKLIHIPSYSVFSNWPPSNTSLHYPRCIDFSPGGGFMAVGNASGKVLLYKLHHYQHA
ncbi:U3 small nucleolar RNA-associated protein 18 homolog [Glycine soja]|uniref:U3 small nucleolar RNA-associated protein 18 homolog n=1 Tax=Glycine soja TaxID=3848 RepID=A0A445GPX6_GLYSO|nr:U3 small nucleolar RNA-associated protein 18 homolog [Glycine soja]KHN33574.1 U3 small nucleolar RNA-associated protein 18 like [Glycine soja]RZB63292.1 U3 small nucleolar RNA-associated protein 18-like isoform A [Glycine soja]RZB63293.1 U3 small nucleolar RNA-associated protein 18-like isoform B [Glycine soja]